MSRNHATLLCPYCRRTFVQDHLFGHIQCPHCGYHRTYTAEQKFKIVEEVNEKI